MDVRSPHRQTPTDGPLAPSGTPRDRLRGVLAWFDASPSELLGLAVLLTGAVLGTVLLWWQARPVPVEPAPRAAVPVTADSAATRPGAVPMAGASDPTAGEVEPTPLTVHVAGAVATPGVVHVPAGARVTDAIVAAGGTTVAAEPETLNLAREVTDGERIVVPVIGEEPAAPVASPGVSAGGGAEDAPIDLNTATATQLEELPNIGPVLAGRIIEFRDEHGGFSEVGQLRDVTGIGEKTFQDLVDEVTV